MMTLTSAVGNGKGETSKWASPSAWS